MSESNSRVPAKETYRQLVYLNNSLWDPITGVRLPLDYDYIISRFSWINMNATSADMDNSYAGKNIQEFQYGLMTANNIFKIFLDKIVEILQDSSHSFIEDSIDYRLVSFKAVIFTIRDHVLDLIFESPVLQFGIHLPTLVIHIDKFFPLLQVRKSTTNILDTASFKINYIIDSLSTDTRVNTVYRTLLSVANFLLQNQVKINK